MTMEQRTSGWKSAFQFLIGIAVIVMIGILAFTLWPRPQVPPGWTIIRPPQDVMAVVEFEDAIWAGGRDGLALIDRESGELVREIEINGGLDFVTSLLIDPDGKTLWIGHLNGLSRLAGDTWKTYTTEDGLLNDRVFSLGWDSEGILWVGTDKGVMWFDGVEFHPAPGQAEVLQGPVSVIHQDRMDRLWFGNGQTTDGGLVMFDGEHWHEFTVENGLVHNMVNAILEDSDGLVWIGTGFANLGGLSLFDGTKMLSFTVEGGLAGPKVRSLYLDGVGNLWAGSEYDGVALVTPSGTKYFTPDDGLSGWEIKSMLQDSEMNLWLGTENGLTKIDQEAWMELTGIK